MIDFEYFSLNSFQIIPHILKIPISVQFLTLNQALIKLLVAHLYVIYPTTFSIKCGHLFFLQRTYQEVVVYVKW